MANSYQFLRVNTLHLLDIYRRSCRQIFLGCRRLRCPEMSYCYRVVSAFRAFLAFVLGWKNHNRPSLFQSTQQHSRANGQNSPTNSAVYLPTCSQATARLAEWSSHNPLFLSAGWYRQNVDYRYPGSLAQYQSSKR